MSSQAPVAFNDVVASFTVEQWMRMESWKKEVYQNAVKEIHKTLLRLGYTILNPEVLFNIQKSEESYVRVDHSSAEREHKAIGDVPDLLLRIKEETVEEAHCSGETPKIKEEEDTSLRSKSTLSVPSLNIKEEQMVCEFEDAPEPRHTNTRDKQGGNQIFIKQEEEVYLIDDYNTVGLETTVQDTPNPTATIKQEMDHGDHLYYPDIIPVVVKEEGDPMEEVTAGHHSTGSRRQLHRRSTESRATVLPSSSGEGTTTEEETSSSESFEDVHLPSGSGSSRGRCSGSGRGQYRALSADSSDDDEGNGIEVSDGLKWTGTIHDPGQFPFTGQPGVKAAINDRCDVYEIFRVFFTPHLLNLIVTETNRYASQTQSQAKTSWTDVSEDDMMCYFGLVMLMSCVRKPVVAAYWSTDPLISTPFFPLVMSRNRFMAIRQFLHFVDNTACDDSDNLFKLRPVVEHLQSVFKSVFVPSRLLSVDESLLLWKGRLGWKQYIPTKRSRFGIKTYELCDSESGYLWNFIVYTSKTSNAGSSGQIVLTLLEGLLDRGYCVVTDTFYSSPSLFNQLIGRTTDAFGTVKLRRKGMPRTLSNMKLFPGDAASMQCGKITALRWRDKRDVSMLSTMHDAGLVATSNRNPEAGRATHKPKIIVDYNNVMRAADKKDQMIEPYLPTRKSLKWYKKLFEHFLDTMVYNAFVVFRHLNQESKVTLLGFRENLITAVIERHHVGGPSKQGGRLPGSGDMPLRLTGRHFPSVIPPTECKANPLRHCRVCSHSKKNGKRIRKESRYMCRECGVALCVVPCFCRFHTLQYYAHDSSHDSS